MEIEFLFVKKITFVQTVDERLVSARQVCCSIFVPSCSSSSCSFLQHQSFLRVVVFVWSRPLHVQGLCLVCAFWLIVALITTVV